MEWPEPIQRVQCISESDIEHLPSRYIGPDDEKPTKVHVVVENIPIVDLFSLYDEHRNKTVEEISDACKERGFFQVINHGVSAELLMAGREVSREFFRLPLEEKQKHANDPRTYVGYGSRIGVQKGAILDWGDYFFHHFLPLCIREEHRWPSKPEEYRLRRNNHSHPFIFGVDVAVSSFVLLFGFYVPVPCVFLDIMYASLGILYSCLSLL